MPEAITCLQTIPALHQPQTQQRTLTPEQNTIKNVEAKVTIPQEVNTMHAGQYQ